MQFAARPFLGNIGAPLREDGDSLGDETEGDASEELELISVELRSGKMGLVENQTESNMILAGLLSRESL